MSIEQLREIVDEPSDAPSAVPTQSWSEIEARLGFSLPGDYRVFLTQYGGGVLAGFYNIFGPTVENRYLNLFRAADETLQAYRQVEASEGIPYPLFEDGTGLYPFGVTENGDVLFWWVEDKAVADRTIVSEARGPIWEEFEVGFTSFLVKALQNQLDSQLLPADLDNDELVFEPIA